MRRVAGSAGERAEAGARAFVRRALLVAVTAAALVALTSCTPPPATRVLFIGNSFTSINGGLDAQLGRLDPTLGTGRVTFGGFTLANHWIDGHALGSIRQGGWTWVVLQEQSESAVIANAAFETYVRAFDAEIRRTGARTVLLMTWERPDAVPMGVTTASLAAAYEGIGKAIGAKVAPAGTAFAESLRERPDLVLNASDGHPTALGTYLAACVVWGTVSGRTPVGHLVSDPAIPGDVQAYLQGVAARALGY